MTEAEWLACEDPSPMLVLVGDNVSQRKRWLYVCACDRRNREETHPDSEDYVAWTEQYAEGQITLDDFYGRWRELSGDFIDFTKLSIADWIGVGLDGAIRRSTDSMTERSVLAATLRDIFGNPIRPVTFSPAWRTDTALALARQVYESRDFGAMPILADALQDAGCEDASILDHCRDTSLTHVRGCWVVDLVLGKQ